ncbi:hypothetical protein ZWY2020_048743 [Hordeum vulgare]|nr:hypothetical protein ZWY2020_048743 [Hordeum vulgare]
MAPEPPCLLSSPAIDGSSGGGEEGRRAPMQLPFPLLAARLFSRPLSSRRWLTLAIDLRWLRLLVRRRACPSVHLLGVSHRLPALHRLASPPGLLVLVRLGLWATAVVMRRLHAVVCLAGDLAFPLLVARSAPSSPLPPTPTTGTATHHQFLPSPPLLVARPSTTGSGHRRWPDVEDHAAAANPSHLACADLNRQPPRP